jgi:2'-5' RNA ligase
MLPTPVRLFVAVDVGPGTGAMDSAPQHLTLRFLGEVASDRLEAIVRALEPSADGVAPFDLRLEGVGAFPDPKRPRVVWVGATVGAANLVALAERVSTALAPYVPPDDRERFVPHLTLFRVRSPRDRHRAQELLSGAVPPPPARAVRVSELLLKESTLTASGAVHRTVRAFPLRGAEAAGAATRPTGADP